MDFEDKLEALEEAKKYLENAIDELKYYKKDFEYHISCISEEAEEIGDLIKVYEERQSKVWEAERKYQNDEYLASRL